MAYGHVTMTIEIEGVDQVIDTLGRLCAQMDDIASRLARIERRQQLQAVNAKPTEDQMSDITPDETDTDTDTDPVENDDTATDGGDAAVDED